MCPDPDLVLLDLNLPRVDGREVLSVIKSDRGPPHGSRSSMLTTSDAEEDVLRSYDLHANAYVTKPVDFDRPSSTSSVEIDDFFLSVVRLPGR